MTDFAIQYSQTTPTGRSPAAPIVADVGAPGRALAGAGREVSRIGAQLQEEKLRKEEKAKQDAIFSEVQNSKIALDELDAKYAMAIKQEPDYTKQGLLQQKWASDRDNLASSLGTFDESKQQIDLLNRGSFVKQNQRFDELRYNKQKDNAELAFDLDFIRTAESGQWDVAEAKNEAALKEGIISNDKYLRNEINLPIMRANYEAQQKDQLVENLYPGITEALRSSGNYEREQRYTPSDKKKAFAFAEAELNKMVKSGQITQVEKEEYGRELDNWIADKTAQQMYEAKKVEKQTTNQEYQDLSKQMTSGTISYESVDQSNLLKADKEKWQTYIKGLYQDKKPEATYEGHLDAVGAVMDSATMQMSPQEAYDSLLTARYVDKSITDEQFKWGINKIENPYPKHMIEDIRAIYNDNNEGHNRFFSFDKERNMKVNDDLLIWIDSQIEQGKTPTRKEMYAQSSQYRTGNNRLVEIGQQINRGGRDYEVVGFDADSEPLVEIVK